MASLSLASLSLASSNLASSKPISSGAKTSHQTNPFEWVMQYEFKQTDEIQRATLGGVAHRLRNLVIKTKNGEYGKMDEEELYHDMYQMLSDMFKQLETLYYIGDEKSREVALAEKMFQFRYPKSKRQDDQTIFRTWSGNFKMGEFGVKNTFHAKASLVALTDALAAKIDYLAEKEFGTRYIKTSEERDPVTKKTVVKKEIVDNRTFNGKVSDGISGVFNLLDKLQISSNRLKIYTYEKFHDVVETLDEHKRKIKSGEKKKVQKKLVKIMVSD